MTDQLTALKALEQAVVAGGVNVPTFYHSAKVALPESPSLALQAYNGSLDAAKKLHEAVLSDEWGAMLADWGPQNEWTCDLSAQLFEPVESGNKCPARAWLLSIIRALIAQLEGE